jgi:DNA-binding PucR family transcriptional regulator
MQTARQLFLHRHTLINRLEKIEEISDLHLDDYYSRLYMSIALLLHDYFVY